MFWWEIYLLTFSWGTFHQSVSPPAGNKGHCPWKLSPESDDTRHVIQCYMLFRYHDKKSWSLWYDQYGHESETEAPVYMRTYLVTPVVVAGVSEAWMGRWLMGRRVHKLLGIGWRNKDVVEGGDQGWNGHKGGKHLGEMVITYGFVRSCSHLCISYPMCLVLLSFA